MKWEENRAPIPAPDAIARRARQLANAHTASKMGVRKRRINHNAFAPAVDSTVSVDPDFDAVPERLESLGEV